MSGATLLEPLQKLLGSSAPEGLRTRIAAALGGLEPAALETVRQALVEVVDLEDRTVRDVLGRDGQPVPIHHFRVPRSEDAESSWDFRSPSPPIRKLRDTLMTELLGPDGLHTKGAEKLGDLASAGKRFLFISNHESVFDLAVLPHALEAAGLTELARRLVFFVNPKIFNTPFINFFICKPVGILKVPQNPRIAANESVMAAEEVKRRAAHGFAAAGARLGKGDSLVIYPEGLRSEGLLHRFARAYLDLLRPEALKGSGLASDEVMLVPWAHRGVRALDELPANAPDVSVSFGPPVTPGDFFETLGDAPRGVAAHLAGFLVARLLPKEQRGLYGTDPETYLDHPHFRLRIQPHTLADIQAAQELAQRL